MKNFIQKLDTLKDKGRYRGLSLSRGLDLTSNDYLGLAEDKVLRDAALLFLQNGGDIGAGGSRLLRGHTQTHAALEDCAAQFFAAPRSLYFSSGFQANLAIFQALPSRHDTIIFDEYIHASAREGIQNAHAAHIKIAHNDLDAFEAACRKAKGQIWIAVESLYSMDGDCADLAALYDLARQYDAMLVIDEAHASGVMGIDGKGLAYDIYAGAARQAALPENIITLHTCGKAMGVAGGLVCASDAIIEMLINTARGFIYSTAPMPLQAHLVQKALEWIASDAGQERRDALTQLCKKAQNLFGAYGGGGGTHIVPIIIGDNEDAVHAAKALQAKGWDIRAIRPPTVPEGTARLRLSLSANLDVQALEGFAADFVGVIKPG